eukprot:Sspe_Gene.32635::Locus_15980_Transcript_1_1_Confidence_1.000_Length_1251::g.32635::m.32635
MALRSLPYFVSRSCRAALGRSAVPAPALQPRRFETTQASEETDNKVVKGAQNEQVYHVIVLNAIRKGPVFTRNWDRCYYMDRYTFATPAGHIFEASRFVRADTPEDLKVGDIIKATVEEQRFNTLLGYTAWNAGAQDKEALQNVFESNATRKKGPPTATGVVKEIDIMSPEDTGFQNYTHWYVIETETEIIKAYCLTTRKYPFVRKGSIVRACFGNMSGENGSQLLGMELVPMEATGEVIKISRSEELKRKNGNSYWIHRYEVMLGKNFHILSRAVDTEDAPTAPLRQPLKFYLRPFKSSYNIESWTELPSQAVQATAA